MKYDSKTKPIAAFTRCSGFTMLEVVAALVILALITSTVLMVIDRGVSSAARSVLRMQAFEVARENMEKLLSADSVKQTADYGTSEKYPEIQWQNLVEVFIEPLSSQSWVRAICSAEYTDLDGEVQTVELTHWLTKLTEQQEQQLNEEKQRQLLETDEQAAEYAGVDVETVLEWVENGMQKSPEGFYIKAQLDLFKATGGKPTAQDLERSPEDGQLEPPTQEPEDFKMPDNIPPELRQLIEQLLEQRRRE